MSREFNLSFVGTSECGIRDIGADTCSDGCWSCPNLIRLLSHADPDVSEQSVWAHGNIAGDSTSMRDMVLAENALPALVAPRDKIENSPFCPSQPGLCVISVEESPDHHLK